MLQILDCTLRDGGYVNDWQFNASTAQRVVMALVDSGIDIVELGYVNPRKARGREGTVFEDLSRPGALAEFAGTGRLPLFCVMINTEESSTDSWGPCQGPVRGVRLAFHREKFSAAAREAAALAAKGYEVFAQPMVTPAYTENELKAMLEAFRDIPLYAMYIVDSFGSLFREDLARLRDAMHCQLPPGVRLGYHAHNNLQLAFSNAIDFVSVPLGRPLIVDASMFGMGRGAGNLNTELLAHYCNLCRGGKYRITPLLECIDSCLEAIHRENNWGYTTAHFLSATLDCHPNYASYFLNKKTLSVVEIEQMLQKIPADFRRKFDRDQAELLYQESRSVKRLAVNLPRDFFGGKRVLVLASGPSVRTCAEKVQACRKGATLVALNHQPESWDPDYYFFSNQKRYDEFSAVIPVEQLLVTDNILIRDRHHGCRVADYAELVARTPSHCDNAAILFLALLSAQGVREAEVAGLDGYIPTSTDNYSYREFGRIIDRDKLIAQNESIARGLKELAGGMAVQFITPSIFKEKK